jgi:diguanylate cyclase (GGDEF)-like protein/PAS domain S-box-containing protein
MARTRPGRAVKVGKSKERGQRALRRDPRTAARPHGGRGALATVSVPEPIRPLFLKAQEYVSRYFRRKVENPKQGTISISGERYILLRAASMSVEFFDLVTSLYQDKGPEEARGVAANLLFDVAHAIGKADARSFHARMGVADPIEKLSAGPIHFSFSGWAFVKIFPESNPTPGEDYFLVYDHPFSFESDAWTKKGRRSDVPVCIMNAGYSSGWCEESFGVPLVAAEIECLAAGGAQCRFIMAPPSRIEGHLARYARETGKASPGLRTSAKAVTVPEFFHRKRMEDELRRSHESLETKVFERTAELVAANERLVQEIAERKRAEEALRGSRQLLQSILDNSSAVIYVKDLEGRFLLINRRFEELFHITREAILDKTDHDLFPKERADAFRVNDFQALAARKALEFEETAPQDDGLHVYISSKCPLYDAAGNAYAVCGISTDITEHKRAAERIRHLAHHDALTGLPNRMLFQDRVSQAIAQAHRSRRQVAVLFVDLDHFKDINDSLGHEAGDRLLRLAGERLERCLREGDSVARQGGDEFVISLPALGSDNDALAVAGKVLDTLRAPFLVNGNELHVSASIGISLYPADGDTADALMRAADAAMYHAKDRGRDNYQFFLPALNAAAQHRLAIANRLYQALPRNEFVLHYQPQLDLESGRILSAEALVRWQPPDSGLILPGEFIKVAEETGLIVPLGEWVLREACAQLKRWRRAGHPELSVAVNLSPRQLRRPGFHELAARVLREEGVIPAALQLEITEGLLMLESPENLAALEQLAAMGVRLAVDDFGTRYSSLAYLQRFPIHVLKIDRSFVSGIGEDTNDTAIVTAIIAMAESLRLDVIAEGVESAEQAAFLKSRGCRVAQGFYYSKAVPADSFTELLAG